MTTKTLNGYYATTYYLNASLTTLSITSSGYLAGGVSSSGAGDYTIVNAGHLIDLQSTVNLAGRGVITNTGTIISTSTTTGEGVVLGGGGMVTNGGAHAHGALIEGAFGVEIQAQAGTVDNSGTIRAFGTHGVGVYLEDGGVVANGSGSGSTALIQAVYGIEVAGAAGTVTNAGTIGAASLLGSGVALLAGGIFTNGSASDTRASVDSQFGFIAENQAATIINYGLIHADGSPSLIPGVDMIAGGLVINGSTSDTIATIDSAVGVILKNVTSLQASGTIENFGTIGSSSSAIGVEMDDSGLVTNGSTAQVTALIEATGIGVYLDDTLSTLENFGTIQTFGVGTIASAVAVFGGGDVVNGAPADVSALMTGVVGVYLYRMAGSVTNYGTITGTVSGLFANTSAIVVNGAVSDTTASISGRTFGVHILEDAATVTNFGTITSGVAQSFGADLADGGLLVNGAKGDDKASITGAVGVADLADGTVTNYATIIGSAGANGVGVSLYSASLANEAGALITGYLGVNAGHADTVSNFGTIRGTGPAAVTLMDAASRFNAEAGSVTIGAVKSDGGLIDAVSGVATISAIMTSGTVAGAGTLALAGGYSQFENGASLTIADIEVSGAATSVDVATNLAYARRWTQIGGTLVASPGAEMTFTGRNNAFSGAFDGSGAIDFAGGTDTFSNLLDGVADLEIGAATVTCSGTITFPGSITAASSVLIVAAAGVTLTGGGALVFSNAATNVLTGATASATLTNADDILEGAGNLGNGKMRLVNQAGGLIDGNDATALILSTGTRTIVNAGLIEATGSGGVTLVSAVNNTGTLGADGGDLLLEGAVTGAGLATIDNGILEAQSAFTENVDFTGVGILILANSTAYAGTIAGFSETGAAALDLGDIAYGGATNATYSGTANSGVLTVTDGTHVARIGMAGNFTSALFFLSSDGHGGTAITATLPPQVRAAGEAPLSAFVAAMASLGPGIGPATTASAEARRDGLELLASPGVHQA